MVAGFGTILLIALHSKPRIGKTLLALHAFICDVGRELNYRASSNDLPRDQYEFNILLSNTIKGGAYEYSEVSSFPMFYRCDMTDEQYRFVTIISTGMPVVVFAEGSIVPAFCFDSTETRKAFVSVITNNILAGLKRKQVLPGFSGEKVRRMKKRGERTSS